MKKARSQTYMYNYVPIWIYIYICICIGAALLVLYMILGPGHSNTQWVLIMTQVRRASWACLRFLAWTSFARRGGGLL